MFSGAGESNSSVDSELVQREKLLQNLDFCVDKISDIFGLGQVVEDVEGNLLDEDQKNKVWVSLKSVKRCLLGCLFLKDRKTS